ncbi:hypothetical protein I350_05625 [Cryptococcus amylolentus CBS 6273]|uniref:Uncharacterized protein n=1 Tax=Cryptococcus amylolentus CBS 6273 TaxID=1296118 RepID=A0A1E3JW43_9TREE|nr:hypothetical protein I350_05625 [Cryptococcus amylolentus CBS 6273]
MADLISSALEHHNTHPDQSIKPVEREFDIPSSTLHDRISGKHPSNAGSQRGKLTKLQEADLVVEINAYAKRGTNLWVSHVQQLAEALAGEDLTQASSLRAMGFNARILNGTTKQFNLRAFLKGEGDIWTVTPQLLLALEAIWSALAEHVSEETEKIERVDVGKLLAKIRQLIVKLVRFF